MEEIRTTPVNGHVSSEGERPSDEAWISPDVVSAMNGEQIEFGKDLDANTDNEDR